MHAPPARSGTRSEAIALARACLDSGRLFADLERRVRYRSESQEPSQASQLLAYLGDELAPTLQGMGFACRLIAPAPGAPAPFLIAQRIEQAELPTVLGYAHGDVVRGDAARWSGGRDPWRLAAEGERWYGRGTADNKGQHSINLAALDAVIQARGGRLGYNLKLLVETGEEIGSPGLGALCEREREALAADLFIASDGPRVSAERPTLFLGSRGGVNFDLIVELRDRAHHSGNWGGALRNPAVVLAQALASLFERNGAIAVPGLRPPPVAPAIRQALADIELGGDPHGPVIDADWGEPGLSPTERVIAWNALEILALGSGNPQAPVNAIPPAARASCQLRYVVGTDAAGLESALREHFSRQGLREVQVVMKDHAPASRLDPRDPWVDWALRSMESSSAKRVALLPNLGGTVPNDVFSATLGLPTLWIPHSYPACAQHAPDEHLLAPVAREALAIMAGIWWDLGDDAQAVLASRARRVGARDEMPRNDSKEETTR